MTEGKCIGLVYLVRTPNEPLLLLDAKQNCKCRCQINGWSEEFVKVHDLGPRRGCDSLDIQCKGKHPSQKLSNIQQNNRNADPRVQRIQIRDEARRCIVMRLENCHQTDRGTYRGDRPLHHMQRFVDLAIGTAPLQNRDDTVMNAKATTIITGCQLKTLLASPSAQLTPPPPMASSDTHKLTMQTATKARMWERTPAWCWNRSSQCWKTRYPPTASLKGWPDRQRWG